MTRLATGAGTIEPETVDALAAALRRANDDRLAVVIAGAGTKADWGRAAPAADVVVSTRRLNRLISHEHGDLTATVEAGATLADVNAALAKFGQWLPLDPPHAGRATIGGILATNDSGPLRHRHGTPRDLVIGVQLALTDGSTPRAGGRVVKNVAGYDLSKLVAGSFGSLAAIATATFKLAPIPPASITVAVDVPDDRAAGAFLREMMGSQLEPMALEAQRTQRTQRTQGTQRAQSLKFLVRFAAMENVIDAQATATRQLAAKVGCAADVIAGSTEAELWRTQADRVFSGAGAIVRAHWLPASIVDVFALLDTLPVDVELVARAALGSGLIRLAGDERAQADAIGRLRASGLVSHVVIVRGSELLKSHVDVWGDQGDNARLFAAVKHAFDPSNILNPGRGPL